MAVMTQVLADRYRLLETIGYGGMGIVYRAHDEVLDRDVAVKVLHPRYAHDPDFIRRFRREARHAASLHHPNIVTIYDTGVDDATGSDFIVMQLVDGEDLDRLIDREGAVGVPFTVRVGIETARALAFAHAHGLIHRDIKPGNILIDREGGVHVADFGIAQAAADSGATTSGLMVGSSHYASPEHVMGEPVGPPSDLYSLGVVLYEALTGVRPFDGPSPAAVALERLRVRPAPVTSIDAALPRPLESIVMRLLEVDPTLRPASAEALAAELERFQGTQLAGRRWTVRDHGMIGAAVASATTADTLAGNSNDHTLPTVARAKPRRRRVAVPTGIGTVATALALAVVGILVMVMAGGVAGLPGAVLSETSGPSGSTRGAAVSPTRPVASIAVAAALPTSTPTASATASPTMTPSPTPRRTPRPKPTLRPTLRPATGAPARDPAETVDRFYRLIELHEFDAAAALWSPRMRRAYPPDRNIDSRFAATTRIDVHRDRITRMSLTNGDAVVSIDISEYRASGAVRRWVGTWDLVLIDGAWLMDEPHLAAG